MVRGFLIAAVILTAGCRSGSTLSRHWSAGNDDAEALVGRHAATSLEQRFGGISSDTASINRLHRIGRRLAAAAPELAGPWHFHLLASDHANAFSLPGRLIYVTRGLYRRVKVDDVLVAAVIAHEMAHVVRKDSLGPKCRTADASLRREMAVDRLAARYLASAGYHADCLPDLLLLTQDVQPPDWARLRVGNLTH